MQLLCHRCGRELTPGTGDWYLVNIEAVADPSPPNLDGFDPLTVDAQMARILEDLGETSEREMMDQVHRRLTLHLCAGCYADWIENPAK